MDTSKLQWKIEGSLNESVNEGITRMNSSQPVDSIPLDCWDNCKSCISLFLVIALFITLLNPQNKQQTSQAFLSHRHILAITKVPLVKNPVYFRAF